MKTVRVRVFVSVSPDGDWVAAGGRGWRDDDAQSRAYQETGNDAGYWVEADLPLPNQGPEIVATVTRA